ncbi:DNA gyrase subunit B [Mycoplasmopsis californica HAZ160_1]|uniref:DNA gyrase subunit B n=1 Tax=Mycoplasmopsis californica HAZ160_1 TaxID=1397850 RepID=A0AAT9F7D0_9BACT|nr:DNA topoisomerase (ATP-hydrolyzing) subunit B [Mycoplasmopsis californica]BAP00785.1 DNA gyrase subunit B [Mycoplasmopsis californica HAZ160_1]BBG40639.1 DNA gyrase subunit B [Mycoplasmopsis californica]BBG41234.1 DNA gyrase subunit B [Mycoplasmopsis californica]BBG41827.1 DNA gyrase subunit B [Mycoplasmopsis californica]BBG42421.1 DNA gyrase subunit B [Mycoplasmopsis californica]
MSQNEYGASNIKVLKGLEAVRVRPGMYIGSTGPRGLHHLIWEIVDNSVDECMAGYANRVDITLTNDGFAVIEDNGRGIPTDIHPETGLSTVETVLTVLHAGGKFDSDSYKVSGGLHGVGASVVNALSTHFEVWVKRNNKLHYASFQNGGQTTQALKVIDDVQNGDTGTKIKFHPDFSIMDEHPFDKNVIVDHAKQIAYLNRNLTISVADERDNSKIEFHFEGGLTDYVKELNKGQKLIHPEVIYAEGEYAYGDEAPVVVEVAVQYNEKITSNVVSYANNIITVEGGTHESGFYDALVRLINNYAIKNGYVKSEEEKFTRDDIKEGIVAIISIKHTDPIFEGQTKGKLGNKDARIAVNKVFSGALERFLDENPVEAKSLVQKIHEARRSRLAGQAARDAARRKTVFDSGSLPGKLADCSSKNAEISELYIVEGNSAGGSAKNGRNRETQAILPLRGKVINVEKNNPSKVFANAEILSIISALGTGVGEDFNINKLRYHKVVIMTDADVDGSHIRTLLLTFFYRYFRPLIEYGFIYIAQPPLYRLQQGKTLKYVYSDAEKDKAMAEMNNGQKITVQRYKGLGEMDAEQLWETTMDPDNRKMLQVQIEDAAQADWVFTTLMGDEVFPRREFIEANAKYVKNIDL